MLSKKDSYKKSPKVAFLELYDALERRLKRHAPRDYIAWMSKRLAESWLDEKKLIQTPPHRIIHSIEANCAYWKEGYREPVTWRAIVKIMNILKGNNKMIIRKIPLTAVCAMFLVSLISCSSQQSSDSELEVFTLDNGLQVIIVIAFIAQVLEKGLYLAAQ